jgi:AcrR family transcriptional regulator
MQTRMTPGDTAKTPSNPPASRSAGGAKPRRSQAERSAESDRRLLRAALKLIGQRGYQGTSLAAIGEEAGYSRGLVNERFGSKSGLLWALVKQMLRIWTHDVRASGDAEQVGLDRLFSLLDNHRRAVDRDEPLRAFYALMFEALGPMPELLPEFRDLHRNFRADIEKTLRAGIEAGAIRADIDPAGQAAVLLATLRGIAFQWLVDREGFPLDAAYEEFKRNLRRELTP